MPRYRVTATIRCPSFVIGVLKGRIRKEVQKASRRGIPVDLENLEIHSAED